MKTSESTVENFRLGELEFNDFSELQNSPFTCYLLKIVYLHSKMKIPKILNNLVSYPNESKTDYSIADTCISLQIS